LKQALSALADLVRVNIKDATKITRQHGLWEEEIHIEEELINLEEAFATNIAAQQSLRDYPAMRLNLIREQRAILTHCIGLLARMAHGAHMPRAYDQRDLHDSMKRLTRLIINEALRVRKSVNKEILAALQPYMTRRQRLSFDELGKPDQRTMRLWTRRLQFSR
jgi:hypothetical protein